MLLDLGYLIDNPWLVVGVTLAVLAVKGIIVFVAAMVLGATLAIGVAAGLGLCQIGEFSFILSMTGFELGLMDPGMYQLFLSVAVVDHGPDPFPDRSGPPGRPGGRPPPPAPAPAGGLIRLDGNEAPGNGKPVRSPDRGRIRTQRPKRGPGRQGGGDTVYGHRDESPDRPAWKERPASRCITVTRVRRRFLVHAGIRSARVLAATLPDPAATRGAVAMARELNPRLYIIARTRFVTETGPLYALGADVVIPEEFETSVEIFTRVMSRYLVPKAEIERFTAEIRAGGYEMFRTASHPSADLGDLNLTRTGVEIVTLRLREDSPAAGRTPAQIDLRRVHGVTLLAVDRRGDLISNPDADTALVPGDLLYLMGDPCRLMEFNGWLHPQEGAVVTDSGISCVAEE